MPAFTLDTLRRIMLESGGVDENVDLATDIGGTEFGDLGFDSLAVLEIQARIKQQWAVLFPEDSAALLHTPDDIVAFVNNAVAVG